VVGAHEMVVIRSTETGAEEWRCPSCGRHLLLRWPPHHERTVLHPGDDRVVHVGGRGEITHGPMSDPPTGGLTDRERRWLLDRGIAWD
jgi:hypothetical protein